MKVMSILPMEQAHSLSSLDAMKFFCNPELGRVLSSLWSAVVPQTLPTPSNDYIELSLCCDEGTANEDIPVGFYELYLNEFFFSVYTGLSSEFE